MNFKSILSLLNQNGLIPHEEYRELLNIPQTDTNHDRIDRLFAIIPSCGHDDFLMRLIHCLRESVPEAGDAHKELADSLQEALNSYVPTTSISTPPEEDEHGSKEKEDGNGIINSEIVADPESALISIEDRGFSRSTLTVEHPNDPSKQGSYELYIFCIF